MFLYDIQDLSSEREFTDEGFLKVPARISRTGVQTYKAIEMGVTDKEPDTDIIVFRPEDEVFKPDSLTSFANKPITDNHPPVMVDATNAKQFSVGMSGHEVTRDGNFAKTYLFITDKTAIDKLAKGKTQISNGYQADIEWTSGIAPDGTQYDAIQRNIRGNHIALVDQGRAGPACRVADSLLTDDTGDKTVHITIDSVDYEVSDQAGQAVAKLQKRLTDAEEEVKEKEDEMEEKEKASKDSIAALEAERDTYKDKVPTAEELDTMLADRLKVVEDAKLIHKDVEWKGKTSLEIMKAVIAHAAPNVQLDSVTDDYIKARFDMLVDAAGDSRDTNSQKDLDDAFRKQQQTQQHQDKDDRPKDVIARDKAMERNRNAWKKEGEAA